MLCRFRDAQSASARREGATELLGNGNIQIERPPFPELVPIQNL
jgi:hypothetical protein